MESAKQLTLLDTEQAAAYLGIAPNYLRSLSRQKKIPHSQPTGGKYFFVKEDIENWVLAARVEPIADCSTTKETDNGTNGR